MSNVTVPLGDTLPAAGATVAPIPLAFDGYVLQHCLGEGGMGEVWLAEQREPVRRNVAVKIIKAGMDTKEVIARFESERQALALMDHPAIARIFDGGRTPDGRPYFVMEHVDGLAIDAHCDRHRLPLFERLRLLIEVCEGVQHAHQKAVIHRDLKPSNILVATVDGKAQPKVIDFGIAKAIGQRLTQRTLLTELGAIIGTPEYMSPEQADSSGQDVDTRTDVYSLGVVLYQLVTGVLPFSSRELRASTDEELRRKLREADPPRPSSRLGALGEEAGEVARERSTDPESLRRQIRGDLDAIILKALEKERTRRYGTVGELAEDLRRHLRNEPVVARPPSTPYRVRKYLRRHVLGVAVAATALVVLAAFTATTAIQARRVARERDRANAEAAAARRVTEFLTSAFRVSDPDEARGNSLTAREVLDRAAAEVESGLAREPELQARMRAILANVYMEMGLHSRARPLADAALASRRKLLGPDAPDSLESMLLLASILREQGNLDASEALLVDAQERADRQLGPASELALRMRLLRSWIEVQRGRAGVAEQLARETLATMIRVLGPKHPQTWRARRMVGMTLSEQARYAEALELDEENLAEAEKERGPDSPDALLALSNVASSLGNLGRPEEALPRMRTLVERERRVLGPSHPRTLLALRNLARTLRRTKHLDEADTVGSEVVEGLRRALGPDHPDTLDAIEVLALVREERGRLHEAFDLEQQALAGRINALGADHPRTVVARYNLGCILARAGRRDEAVDQLRAAVQHGLPRDAIGALPLDEDLASLRGHPGFEKLLAESKAAGTPR